MKTDECLELDKGNWILCRPDGSTSPVLATVWRSRPVNLPGQHLNVLITAIRENDGFTIHLCPPQIFKRVKITEVAG